MDRPAKALKDDGENILGAPFSQDNAPKLKRSASFPPEILLSIFQLAIPPYTLLDTTLNAGQNSTWNQALRLMKSIVLVCRGWYDAGIIFLYKNICIRRGQELKLLRQTLTSIQAQNLGLLVKSLAIQCYAPEDECDFGTILESVLVCCTSLSTFAFNTPFVPPLEVIPIAFPAHITHLRLEGYFNYCAILPVLKLLEGTLLSLHIMIWGGKSSQPLSFKRNFLRLSSLQSLTVAALQDFGFLGTCWAMPSLQRLTVVRDGLFRHNYRDYLSHFGITTALISLLSVLGHQIRQLHLAVEGFEFEPTIFKQVLKFCPRLERLVVHPSTFSWSNWLEDFVHPRLRCIDLTYLLRDHDDYRPSELCLSKKNLPSLECVRRFCNLTEELFKWLDDYYPPTPEAEMDGTIIDVFQHHLDCRDGLYVWMLERDVLEDRFSKEGIFSGSFTVWEDDNSDEDSDYIPTSSDEEEDSSEEGDRTSELSDFDYLGLGVVPCQLG